MDLENHVMRTSVINNISVYAPIDPVYDFNDFENDFQNMVVLPDNVYDTFRKNDTVDPMFFTFQINYDRLIYSLKILDSNGYKFQFKGKHYCVNPNLELRQIMYLFDVEKWHV